jgi:membrane protein implicated in regulation of membrane protease activity|tara:strand:- start:2481 stop:2870 length:390 start_codon:yes stop_codon:yes gene_type:complete
MSGLGPAFWWTLAGVLLMLCEFVVPGLILFFFGIGAFVVALVTAFWPGLNVDLQIVAFLVSSLITLFSLRRLVRSVFAGRVVKESNAGDMTDGLIGSEATVIAAMKAGELGKVRLNGVVWKDESEAESC